MWYWIVVNNSLKASGQRWWHTSTFLCCCLACVTAGYPGHPIHSSFFFVSVMRCPAMAEKFLTPPYNWHECCWFTLWFSFLETASLAPLNHFALSLPYSMFCNVIIAFLRHRKPTALKCCRWSWRITHSLLLALLFLLCCSILLLALLQLLTDLHIPEIASY